MPALDTLQDPKVLIHLFSDMQVTASEVIRRLFFILSRFISSLRPFSACQVFFLVPHRLEIMISPPDIPSIKHQESEVLITRTPIQNPQLCP